jgi:phosphodiesterase/alkaline phosphatase D-like protein
MLRLATVLLATLLVWTSYPAPARSDSLPSSAPTAPGQQSLEPWVWSGAVTERSATINARVPGSAKLWLVVSTNADLSDPVSLASSRAVGQDNWHVMSVTLSDLQPDTFYHYGVLTRAGGEPVMTGSLRTFPDTPASFRVAFGACAETGSSAPVFDTIRAADPLLYLAIGDLHYADIDRNDPDRFREAYDQVLTAPAQARLYRSTPIAYVWDDHDYGSNNSNASSRSRAAARAVYQEAVPHYPLAAGAGDVPIYQAFSIGRVRFIVTDLRSAKRPLRSTMLGSEQKRWLLGELLAARDSHAAIIWISTVPWIAERTWWNLWWQDNWGGFARERREIADFIHENSINNLFMLAGDAHMLAMDSGEHSNYARRADGQLGFPVMHAGALDRPGSVKGGPYTLGPLPGGGQFGLMTVTDSGQETVEIRLEGMDQDGERLLGMTFTVRDGSIVARQVIE